MANDKTEKATPKKKDDARKKGQVAKSADINGAAILLAGLIALSAAGPKAMEQMKIAMIAGHRADGAPAGRGHARASARSS